MTAAPFEGLAGLADRYRVERELGAGGMATVYLARDLKHDRDVAIKVLREDLGAALGPERFLAEIKTTAKLQHPHILPLLDSGNVNGYLFYVMPLVEGETLRHRIDRERQLPLDDAVRIATEVAGALDYAHRHGVIHRDIKPENILLHDGRAVVADFGIALAVSAASGPRMTQTGLSLGTPQYMAPEQAMGERQIDGRADVYALGAVLYEMLTGEPPFSGATVQAIVAKVLTERPMNPTAVRDTIPRHVEATVLKALAKLPADRFATPAQFSAALAHPEIMSATLQQPPSSHASTSVAAMSGWRRQLTASPLIWAALAAIAGVAALGWLRNATTSRLAMNVVLADLSLDSFSPGLGISPGLALSRDGSMMVFSGIDSTRTPRLVLRSLIDADAGGVFVSPSVATSPAFSPNGAAVAFYSQRTQTIQIFRIATRNAQSLGVVGIVRGISWIDDSTIVFSARNRLRRWRIGARESQSFAGAETDSVVGRDPYAATPDLLLVVISAQGNSELATVSVRDHGVTPLGIRGTRPQYVKGGTLTYLNDGALWAVPVDQRTLKVRGAARAAATAAGDSRLVSYAVADNGVLVAARAASTASRELVIVDRAGVARALVSETRNFRWPRFSPDGRRIAVSLSEGAATPADLYVVRADASGAGAGTIERITSDSATAEAEWDPDGRSLIFRHARGRGGISRTAADGSGSPVVLLTRPNVVYETAITPDRKTIVWREDAPNTSRDILSAPLDSPTAVRPIRNTAFDERGFSLSPDGKWLAYTSNEAGTNEVYLCRIEANGAHWRVSRQGGSEPRWARTGELFYRNGDSVLVSRITLGAEPTIGAPVLLFRGQYDGAPFEPLWDVSPDAKQFVMVRNQSFGGARLVLMLDWIDAWRRGATTR